MPFLVQCPGLFLLGYYQHFKLQYFQSNNMQSTLVSEVQGMIEVLYFHFMVTWPGGQVRKGGGFIYYFKTITIISGLVFPSMES